MTNGSRDSFQDRDDQSCLSVPISTIIEVVLIKHGRKGQNDFKNVSPHASSVILLCLKRGVVIEFGKESFDIQVFDMNDRFMDCFGAGIRMGSFVNCSNELQ